MSVWFAFWVVLSLFLFGFVVWTLYIVVRQKQAWKAFSVTHGLRYTSSALMRSPEMDGVLEGYKFSFFTSEHTAPDMRGQRKMTAVEVTLHSTMPFEGGVASHGLIPVLKGLAFKTEVKPASDLWSAACVAGGDHRFALEAYLTPERIQILMNLAQIPYTWMILLFKGDAMLLRLDTSSPLETVEKLEKVRRVMRKAASVLELHAGEAVRLRSELARMVPKEALAPAGAPVQELALEEDEISREAPSSADGAEASAKE